MLKNRTILDICILLLLSLTPFLWLRGGFIVTGHDAGLPLSPTAHFADRLHTWTSRYAEGSDQSFALAGFFIHGFEAFLDQFGLSLSAQQSIQFSVYFFLMGLSMYIFSRTFFEKEPGNIPLLAAVVYQYNHFVLQAWFIAERTKFSLYIALPLFLTLFFLVLTKNKSPFKYGLIAALVLLVLNGGGFLPLYGAFFVVLPMFSAGMLFFSQNRWQMLAKIAVFFTTVLAVTLPLQAYWLLPYSQYVRFNFAASVAQSGGVAGVIHWLKSISEHTSYINMLRLQGIQEWYVNSQHPYAAAYTTFLPTLLSFAIPTIFIFALKQHSVVKKHILVLTFVALASLFFMAGSHDPFGWLYIQMIKYVPGFVAFRTPFYKFSPGLYIAIAPLFAYLVGKGIAQNRFFSQRKLLSTLACVGLVLVYNFPFFTHDFFQYTEKLTNKVSVPEHVYEYGAYANSSEYAFNRTLLVPGTIFDTGVAQYQWGYWSLASLHSLLDTNTYVTRPQAARTLKDKLLIELYDDLLEGGSTWPLIAHGLHIDSILVQEDFVSFDYNGKAVQTEKIKAVLETSELVSAEKELSPWTLYRFSDQKLDSNAYVTLGHAAGSQRIGSYLFEYLQLPTNTRIFAEKLPESEAYQFLGSVLVPECEDCYLLREQVFLANQNAVITPGSSLYGISKLLGSADNTAQTLLQDPVQSLQNLYVIRTQFDRKDEYAARAVSWKAYVESLRAYELRLSEFLASYQPSVGGNKTVQGYYANVLAQKTLLDNLALFVNQAEEARYYTESFEVLTTLTKKLEERIFISRSQNLKEYAVDIVEPGEYSLSVYLPSTNYLDNTKNPIEFSVNGKPHSIENYTNDTQWLSLGTFPLSAGSASIVFSDASLQTLVDSGSRTYSKETSCQYLYLGELSKDRYQFTLSTLENFSDIDFSVHVTEVGTTTVALPYWGIGFEKESVPGKYVVLFDALEDTEYELAICDGKYLDVPPITIDTVVIDRISVPVLALSVVLPQSQPLTTESGSVTMESSENTVVSVSWTTPQLGLMTVPVPYSSNWAAAQGVLFPDSLGFITTVFDTDMPVENTTLKITYQQEKYLRYGAIISIISAASVVLAVLFVHKK